jgi:putative tricarboxylic transport membrane protein
MLVGVAVGFVVGILPGLGGPTTLALMLPFVFALTPVNAFALLLGMLAVTNTTGDITSILFGIPGEPTTAATVVDGHAMAKNGEAGRALGAAMMSSLVGAVFGALVLALAIPLARPLVTAFGSPEILMLAVLGVTFVATLSARAIGKGLIAGALGLWLASIGLDPVTGTERYTFGRLFLWDGIGLVPVTIGLYAIPELIELAAQGGGIARGHEAIVGRVREGVRDTLRHWSLVLRASAIGTFVSLIPGLGAATTQWIAYAHAVQTSPRPDRFGKGAVEGVLAPGAANNASLGGSLVTTVVFGVPASLSTSILMGAFFIHGLVPGPPMVMPPPKGHLVVTLTMVWTIVISNIVTVAVCLTFMDTLARITRVRGPLLFPSILMLVYVGAFAEKNTFADLGVALVFGALGWMMVRLDWPRPPLLLGLVLGPVVENKLFLSIDNYGARWLARPAVIAILAVIVVGAVVSVIHHRRERQTAITPAPRGAGAAFSIGLVALFAWILWQSRDFDTRVGIFPRAAAMSVLGLAAVQCIRDLYTRPASDAGHGQRVFSDDPAPPPSAGRTTWMWILGTFGAIWLLGFAGAIGLMTLLHLRFSARARWPMTTALSLLNLALVYGGFEKALGVPFPSGQLLVWMGLD